MPAKSEAQARLMRAAEHGADFPKAKAIRASMSPEQIQDFSRTGEDASNQTNRYNWRSRKNLKRGRDLRG
jgi:hypothetical protein